MRRAANVANQAKLPVQIFLRGETPGKKNDWKRKRGGGMFLAKEIHAMLDSLILQARSQWPYDPLEAASIRMGFTVKNGASDLDGKYTTIQDVLVKAGVLRNDSIKRVWMFSARGVINPNVEESVLVTLE